jgi:uncharacterized protein YjbI with pentapeptide repeats
MAEALLFTDEDLSGRSFAGEDLAGAEFSNCRLVSSNFRGADLSSALFERCVAFSPGDESSADFSFANLREARFLHCDLTAVELANTRAYGLCFDHCQLMGASLAGADFRLPIGSSADLAEFTMSNCNFAYGDLSNTFCKDCQLLDNRMVEALLDNTVLEGASLRGCDLSNIEGKGLLLRGADLRGAVFNNINPRNIDLTGVRITLEQVQYLLEPLGIEICPDADI